MNDNKFIVTLEGYDAETATPEQCSVHSDYPIPKMENDHYGTVEYTFTADPPVGTLNMVTIPHGYNYTPMAIVFAEDTSGSLDFVIPIKWYVYKSVPGLEMTEQLIKYYVDDTNLKIDYVRTEPSMSPDPGDIDMNGRIYTFKYYIFVENL